MEELKIEYRRILLSTSQFEKIGQLLENEGKFEEALNMYMKGNKLIRVPNLISKYPQLLDDHAMVANILKNLLKQELYESAAEIYEKLDKHDLAMECYRKGDDNFCLNTNVRIFSLVFMCIISGKIWNKAVDLARTYVPDKVIQLEEEWGDSLVENKQMDAAISHYIEAGCNLKALDAAVAARQWKKAVHIVKVIDDPETVQKYYVLIANYFAGIKVLLTHGALISKFAQSPSVGSYVI